VPLAAAVIGREVALRDLDAFGLSEMMRSQKQRLLAHSGFPSGLAAMLDIREKSVTP